MAERSIATDCKSVARLGYVGSNPTRSTLLAKLLNHMIVIGITGEIGSGKDTFSNHLIKIAKGKKIIRTRFSDILKETLTLWDLPHSRHNLQYLAIIMDKQYGKGTLTHAISERIKKIKADIVLVEGVRWLTDVPLIRSFDDNRLVYITADLQKRFLRVKKRAEKVDEKSLTISRFRAEDKALTETHIERIGRSADVKIENNSSIATFKKKIETFYKDLHI